MEILLPNGVHTDLKKKKKAWQDKSKNIAFPEIYLKKKTY